MTPELQNFLLVLAGALVTYLVTRERLNALRSELEVRQSGTILSQFTAQQPLIVEANSKAAAAIAANEVLQKAIDTAAIAASGRDVTLGNLQSENANRTREHDALVKSLTDKADTDAASIVGLTTEVAALKAVVLAQNLKIDALEKLNKIANDALVLESAARKDENLSLIKQVADLQKSLDAANKLLVEVNAQLTAVQKKLDDANRQISKTEAEANQKENVAKDEAAAPPPTGGVL